MSGSVHERPINKFISLGFLEYLFHAKQGPRVINQTRTVLTFTEFPIPWGHSCRECGREEVQSQGGKVWRDKARGSAGPASSAF